MKFDATSFVLKLNKPGRVIWAWVLAAVVIGLTAPNLTKLAAEGQAKLVGGNSESHKATEILKEAWPEQAHSSMAVLELHRPGGITQADRDFAIRIASRLEQPDRPSEVLNVLSPKSTPEIAERLLSHDGTVQLVAIALKSHFVSPNTQDVVAWLKSQADSPEAGTPKGLERHWTGDAVIGIDYMAAVQTSLDRAAIVTVFLLLIVLLVVYRSIWLALVPLVTIGISLVISRGCLAWLYLIGWEISPLVELFLVAILFGTGTDFCLFLSWRFVEHFNEGNPAGAMRVTLIRSFTALVTSAGTIIVGLLLMGTTQFKLFSTTGPSVALGLIISLIATLTLTPALLVLLARVRPGAFRGLMLQDPRFWDTVSRVIMARPLRWWALTLIAMIPLALLSIRTHFVQDLMVELPKSTSSVQDFSLLASKFDPGMAAPLTVILESDTDLRTSQGLALIDDVSKLLSHQRRLVEVRSATQPLGSPEPLKRARIASRLQEVNSGFDQLTKGATQLQKGLMEGAAKLQAALWLEQKTGLKLTGMPFAARVQSSVPPPAPATRADVSSISEDMPGDFPLNLGAGLPSGWNMLQLGEAFDALAGNGTAAAISMSFPLISKVRQLAESKTNAGESAGSQPQTHAANMSGRTTPDQLPGELTARKRDDAIAQASQSRSTSERPQETLLRELKRAADGAGQIASGAGRAMTEVTAILQDPVGRRALDRLLITPQTVRENPELNRSFESYITPDGHHARIDLVQGDRVFSNAAMDQVDVLRRRLKDYLGEYDGIRVTATIAGGNAESADVRTLTRADQIQSWFVVPIGVFLVLLISLRDPWACVNLVATMVLTYAFSLGATHLAFVTILGAPGLDWKVPYFLFVLLVAVGVDYNVFLMTRLQEEARERGLRTGIRRAIAQTGGLITSAAAITACSFASFMFSPLSSLRQLGFALVIGILIDATLVRPLLVPCGHWLLRCSRNALAPRVGPRHPQPQYAVFTD